MRYRSVAAVCLWLFVAGTLQAEQGSSAVCLGCHDFGPESPVHPMLEGPHGTPGGPDTPMSSGGCQACHGPSEAHAQAPTRVSPSVSFGPRWSATAEAQDAACLDCHEANVAQHWKDALHMVNNVTCVTCHDAHAREIKADGAAGQMELCGTCHKAQQSGMHGLQEMAAFNPACTTCHNPHDDRGPVTEMLDNRSEGCRSCHDLVRMASSAKVSDKAKSYHKVMAQTDRTCLDCHQSIAHAAPDSVAPLIPEPANSRIVTLFFPGQADSEWLVSRHPGSQPLRQGTGCQQCHRGEERAMGVSRAAGNFEPASVDVTVAFSVDAEDLVIDLSWSGDALDRQVSLFWGDGTDESVRRGSCFAACHADMPGMSRDRGAQVDKYLWASLAQQQQIGLPAISKSEDALSMMVQEGQYAELWRITLGADAVASEARVLAGIDWLDNNQLSADARFDQGRWQVTLRRPLNGLPGTLSFSEEGKYSLGIALNGQDNPGGRHWVSLPLSLSLPGNDTDFRAN